MLKYFLILAAIVGIFSGSSWLIWENMAWFRAGNNMMIFFGILIVIIIAMFAAAAAEMDKYYEASRGLDETMRNGWK